MKNLFFLLSALLVSIPTIAKADTIYTNGADEYADAVYSAKSDIPMSVFSDDETAAEEMTVLFVSSDSDIEDCGASYDICDEYGIHTLIYDSSEAADNAYDYFTDNGINVCRNSEMELSSAASDMVMYSPYLSWGPSYIGTEYFTDALYKKYSLVNNMPSVTVAVIDSGIDYTHSFLSERVDSSKGYDYQNNDSDAMDDNHHGTHVAGIIADNTLPNVTLIPIKVSDKDGRFTTLELKQGLQKAIDLKVDVINMSIGSSTPDTNQSQKEVFASLINRAYRRGIIMCAAAGNGYTVDDTYTIFDSKYIFPAYMDNVITVANSTKNGEISSTSNYGTVIDLAAPGTLITSTYPNNQYRQLSGTSMACPFVSAAAALLKTNDINTDTDDARTELTASVTDFSASYNLYYGAGILSLKNLSKYVTYDYQPTASPSPTPSPSPSPTPTASAAPISLVTDDNSYRLYMETNGTATAFIAYYKNGILSDKDSTSFKDEISISIPKSKVSKYDTVKVFLWNNLDDMTALSKACEITAN